MPASRVVRQSPLFIGSALATTLLSVIVILLLFVPYGGQTIHFNYVRSTSSSLPNGQYLTSAEVYVTSKVIATNTAGSYTYTYTSTNTAIAVTTYTAAPGLPNGVPYESEATYSGTTYDYSGTTVYTYPFTSTYTYTEYPVGRSLPTPVPQQASPEHNLAPRQASSASASSSSATPLPMTTSANVTPIRPGSVVSLWMLIECVLFIVIAVWGASYLVWRTRRLQREAASADDGINGDGEGGATQPLAPQDVETPGSGQRQRPPPSVGANTDATAAESTSFAQRKGYVRISYARTQFVCLVILAALLQVPLGLLAYTASSFSSAATSEGGYYGFIGGIVDSQGNWPYGNEPTIGSSNTSPLSGYCVPEDGTQISGSSGGYYYPQNFAGQSPQSCPGGQGAYVPEFGSSPSFAKYAYPVVLVLVFGWLLFLSIVALCVLLCYHRGESRKQRRQKRNEEVNRTLMMEMWRAGWQAQADANNAAAAAAAAHNRGQGPPMMMYGQPGGISWCPPRAPASAGYGPVPTTPMSQREEGSDMVGYHSNGGLDGREAPASNPRMVRQSEASAASTLTEMAMPPRLSAAAKGKGKQRMLDIPNQEAGPSGSSSGGSGSSRVFAPMYSSNQHRPSSKGKERTSDPLPEELEPDSPHRRGQGLQPEDGEDQRQPVAM